MTASHSSPFYQLAPGLGVGCPPSPVWRAIAHCPLVILVGVTGVGKSTTLEALAARLPFHPLPNRRQLTDDLIIAHLQRREGQPIQPVTDRTERFAFTRRYRELYPGGMGHALGQLWVEQRSAAEMRYVFDGLRGVNEVRVASQTLPAARFVVLHAPDAVRVQRLLGRGDSFDRVAADASTESPVNSIDCFADIDLPAADDLFASDETASLLSLCTPPVGRGTVPVDELQTKLKIVLEERRNYDPAATLATLQKQAPERTLILDTTRVSAISAAEQIATWLRA